MFAMVAFFFRVGESGVKETRNEKRAVARLVLFPVENIWSCSAVF